MADPVHDPLTNWLRPNLRQLIRAQGRKQNWLAATVGITPKHLNQMLQGHIGISAEMGSKLLSALGYRLQFGLKAENEEARDAK